MPVLSIIVPVYNVEKFLRECVESILSQSFTDYELILVDDGSTDNSGPICDEYSKLDNRIVVIHKKNGGQSSARNIGIDKAKGDYLTFIDSDDYLADKYTFEPNINILQSQRSLSFVQYPITRTGIVCEKRKTIICDKSEMFKLWLTPPTKTLTNYVCDKIFRKEVFENIRFPNNQIFEDRYVFSMIIKECNSIYINDFGLYFYRTNATSTTHQKRTMYFIKCQILADINTLNNIPQSLVDQIAYVYWNILCNYSNLRTNNSEIIEIPHIKLSQIIKANTPIGIKLNLLLSKLLGVETYVKLKS